MGKKPICKDCKYYVYTDTLGSEGKKVWHCRHGFTPFSREWGTCQDNAEYNDNISKTK